MRAMRERLEAGPPAGAADGSGALP